MTDQRLTKGIFLMLIASIAFALMGACVKAVPSQLSIAQIVWFRSAVALVCLIPWMFRRKISFRGRHPFFLSLRALAGALAIFCYFFTVRRLNLATAVVLNYTSPIFVMLLAIPFLKERLSWNLTVPFSISFAGIVCLALPELSFRGLPFSAGLAAGFLAAVAYVTISYLGRFESPLTVVFYFTLWSLILSIPLLPGRFREPVSADWIFLVGAGLFGLVGQWGMTNAYFHGPASVISIFSCATPLIAYLLGLFFWQEKLSPLTTTGILLIIAGSVALSVRYHRSRGV